MAQTSPDLHLTLSMEKKNMKPKKYKKSDDKAEGANSTTL